MKSADVKKHTNRKCRKSKSISGGHRHTATVRSFATWIWRGNCFSRASIALWVDGSTSGGTGAPHGEQCVGLLQVLRADFDVGDSSHKLNNTCKQIRLNPDGNRIRVRHIFLEACCSGRTNTQNSYDYIYHVSGTTQYIGNHS